MKERERRERKTQRKKKKTDGWETKIQEIDQPVDIKLSISKKKISTISLTMS